MHKLNTETGEHSGGSTCSAIYIGSEWVPKKGGLPWKLTDIYHSEMGRTAVQLEKYQGGRNSPVIITTKRLRRFFMPNAKGDVRPHEQPERKRK